MNIEKLKEWFEANYLDGDKIQGGQMQSSEDCFNAVTEAYHSAYEAGKKEFAEEGMVINDNNYKYGFAKGAERAVKEKLTETELSSIMLE